MNETGWVAIGPVDHVIMWSGDQQLATKKSKYWLIVGIMVIYPALLQQKSCLYFFPDFKADCWLKSGINKMIFPHCSGEFLQLSPYIMIWVSDNVTPDANIKVQHSCFINETVSILWTYLSVDICCTVCIVLCKMTWWIQRICHGFSIRRRLAYMYKPQPWYIKERLLNVIYNVSNISTSKRFAACSCFHHCYIKVADSGL